jgi:hypothetical protein
MRGERGPQARRDQDGAAPGHHQPIPPGLPDSPGGKLKDPAIRRDRDMAILRQRAGFDWRV